MFTVRHDPNNGSRGIALSLAHLDTEKQEANARAFRFLCDKMGGERGHQQASSKWRISTSTLVMICSLSGIPISRACSLMQDYYDSFVLFAIGTGVLFGLILLVALKDGIRNTDPIYFGE